jgi:hypothetical protein
MKTNHEIKQLADAMQRMQVSFAIVYERLKAIKMQSKAVKAIKNDEKKFHIYRISKRQSKVA